MVNNYKRSKLKSLIKKSSNLKFDRIQFLGTHDDQDYAIEGIINEGSAYFISYNLDDQKVFAFDITSGQEVSVDSEIEEFIIENRLELWKDYE